MDSSELKTLGTAVGTAIADQVGKLAYEAYSAKAGGLTYDGKPMPTWDALGDEVQGRWNYAAQAVVLGTMRVLNGLKERHGF